MNARGSSRSSLIAVLAVAFVSQLCAAQEITVAAGADHQYAMQDIAARFQKETGKTVKLIYGSSWNFFQQILFGSSSRFCSRLNAKSNVDRIVFKPHLLTSFL